MKYDQIYKSKNVWGIKPNELLQKVFKQLGVGLSFLDLGCGQGRDSLFMLQNGFKVTAVDSSQKGIDDIKENIKKNNFLSLNIDLFCEDIRGFNIEKDKYDIINIINILHFLPKKEALQLVEVVKENIKNKGYIIFSGFTTLDSLFETTINKNRGYFEPNELKNLFSDFDLIFYEEKTIPDKGHSGNPQSHTHSVIKMIAQKKFDHKKIT